MGLYQKSLIHIKNLIRPKLQQTVHLNHNNFIKLENWEKLIWHQKYAKNIKKNTFTDNQEVKKKTPPLSLLTDHSTKNQYQNPLTGLDNKVMNYLKGNFHNIYHMLLLLFGHPASRR